MVKWIMVVGTARINVGDRPDHKEAMPSVLEIFRKASRVPVKYFGLLNHLQSQISCCV